MTLKKLALSVAVLSLIALIHLSASAVRNSHSIVVTTTTEEAEDFINEMYNEIDFTGHQKLNPEVFSKAMHGYLNLKSAGKLSENKQIITIADFSQPSTQNRLWVIDLDAKKVLYNTFVAHGQGSGNDMATVFSNTNGTHASSLGFYVTADTYMGQHGNSLRLNGMDNGFNDAALDRGIVVHAADYVSKNTIAGQGRLGRSWGCPAIAPELAQPIINIIKGGTCLFIYSPQPQYLKTAYWLNKKVENVEKKTKLPLADAPNGNRL